MAKINLKLDTRKNCQKKDGSFPLILSLHHKSKTRSIGLKYSFKTDEWDAERLIPIDVKNAKHIGAKIESYLMKARVFLNEHKLDIEIWSMKELKTMLQTEIFSNVKTTKQTQSKYVAMKLESTSLTEFSAIHINRLRLAHRNKTADSFKEAIARLKDFSNSIEISFTEVDIAFLENFTAYCYSRRNKASTVHTYLRRIRKLFNSAIDSKFISDEIYPFKTFKFPKLPKTKNRALKIEDIESIRALELKPNSAVWYVETASCSCLIIWELISLILLS